MKGLETKAMSATCWGDVAAVEVRNPHSFVEVKIPIVFDVPSAQAAGSVGRTASWPACQAATRLLFSDCGRPKCCLHSQNDSAQVNRRKTLRGLPLRPAELRDRLVLACGRS